MWFLRRFSLAEMVLGGFCLGLGGYMLADVGLKPGIATRAAVGPGVFPAIIALALVAVGLRLLWEARAQRGRGATLPELDLKAAAIGAAAFLAMILTLEWLGWVIAGTLMYATVAHAFGARRSGLSLLLGLGLTIATYLLFDRGLDLSLPVGRLVEPVLARFNIAF